MENKKNILDYLHFHLPTVEQKLALEALAQFVDIANKEDFFILSGAAGTGKTSITSALVGYLNKDTQYRIIAPTGRAARILEEGIRSSLLRLMGIVVSLSRALLLIVSLTT
jgi:exodeoxyribonuclease-5